MRVAILGAGITGLTLAWKLRQRDGEKVEIQIFDKAPRAGGWIQTIEKEGFLFELGPRSCRPYGHGVETLKLIQELGMEDEVIHAAPAARRRYLLEKGMLRSLPASFFELMISPWCWRFLLSVCKEPWQPRSAVEDESIESFFLRRLGPEVTYRLVDALVSGIYAGDISQLSMAGCFPSWHGWEKDFGSLLRGAFKHPRQSVEDPFIKRIQKGGIFTMRKGMGSLIHQLAGRLKGLLFLDSKVIALVPEKEKINVVTEKGQQSFDHVFSTLPQGGVELLGLQPTTLKNTSAVVVSLGYSSCVLPKEGFGYLVPTREKQEILGVVWDSSAFPQQNRHPQETRLTVMMGGEHHPTLIEKEDKEISQIALDAVMSQMGIHQAPDVIHVHRAVNAIPQYMVGHAQRIEELREAVKRKTEKLTLVGTSFDGVSVNDAIAAAVKK